MDNERSARGRLTVNDDIGSGGVRAGIADQVHIGTLQLLGVTVATHGDHGLPQVLDLLVNKIGETGVDVAGGDAVDACEISPFVGQGSSQVKASGLGDVVGSLLLGEVGNVAGHGGGDDEASGATLLEVMADGLGAVEGSSEIGLDDFVPVLDAAVEDTGVGGSAGVGDEGVDLAEILDDVLDELVNALVVTDIAFVGL